ncbi:IclR family transcriptional regulator [Pseudorhodoferax sp.]|uniref:IclR family transcriptional regulator n=1 Tax=Pseudorhodoferax sp. TaxID=1993553 RepID=UPI002DD69DA1|nr:IclR family transcriptional regulator [Pseudorhodoferax sp.]
MASATPQLTVERGLGVLRAFRSERAPLSNAELVRRTGLPKATVSRLTSTMLQLGFVRHVGDSRQFELAPGPLGIGHAFLAGSDLLERVNPVLQALADQLEASVALGIPDRLDMVYVAYRAGRRVGTLRLGVGSVLPMGRTAIGHAYLWSRPPRVREPLLQALRGQAHAHAAGMERSMRNSFRELDATGTCAVLGLYQRNACAVARPVAIGPQRTMVGLSCGKAHLAMDLATQKQRMSPAVMDTAARLERLLADFEDVQWNTTP